MICMLVVIVGVINYTTNIFQITIMGAVSVAVQEEFITVIAQFVTSLGAGAIQLWLGIGQTLVILDLARGQQSNYGKLFSGSRYLVNTALAMICIGLAGLTISLVLIGIPCGIAALLQADREVLLAVFTLGGIIAIAPISLLILRCSQAQLLVIDRGLRPVEALQMSNTVTNGNTVTICLIGGGLMLMCIPVMSLGLLALCIGIIPAMIGMSAFATLVYVVTYLCMTNQLDTDPHLQPAEPVVRSSSAQVNTQGATNPNPQGSSQTTPTNAPSTPAVPSAMPSPPATPPATPEPSWEPAESPLDLGPESTPLQAPETKSLSNSLTRDNLLANIRKVMESSTYTNEERKAIVALQSSDYLIDFTIQQFESSYAFGVPREYKYGLSAKGLIQGSDQLVKLHFQETEVEALQAISTPAFLRINFIVNAWDKISHEPVALVQTYSFIET